VRAFPQNSVFTYAGFQIRQERKRETQRYSFNKKYTRNRITFAMREKNRKKIRKFDYT